jgi:hypothetical protein
MHSFRIFGNKWILKILPSLRGIQKINWKAPQSKQSKLAEIFSRGTHRLLQADIQRF